MADKKLEPLNDDECQELMDLFRIIRNGNGTPADEERYADLRKRFEINRRGLSGERRTTPDV